MMIEQERATWCIPTVAALVLSAGLLASAPVMIASAAPGNPPHGFKDPLDVPAQMRSEASKRPLQAVTRAGGRLVAVGLRGMIAVSDDQGRSWFQKRAPVQTDLLAVCFVNDRLGWASGHDSVILHTTDGGETWSKQLDGREAGASLLALYQQRVDAGDASLRPYLDQVRTNYQAGPSVPLLGIWFTDAAHGYAVGSFGMLIVTQDGGRTWQPWLEGIDDPNFLHLNAITDVAGQLVIAAEQGLIFRLNPASGRFEPVATGHTGSFFSIAGNEEVMLVGGLRGVVYASADRGASWRKLEVPLRQTISGAAYLPSADEFALVSIGGEVAVSDRRAGGFHVLKPARPMVFTGVLDVPGGVVLTGMQGSSVQPLDSVRSTGGGR